MAGIIDKQDNRFWPSVKRSLSGEHIDFTTGSLRMAIVLLAIPMVLELSMESLFAIIDIFWVGKLGSAATAAVGLTESVMTLFYAVAIGISMSVTAMVSRRVGEKDFVGGAKVGAQAVYIAFVVGVLTGIPCILYADRVLGLMGGDAEVIAMGTGYLRITMGANVIVLLLFLINAIFRGAGDAALAMRTLILGNCINIVLDPVFIFGLGPIPAMGVTGAAVATLTGRTIAVCYQFYALKKGSRLPMAGGAWKPDLRLMGRLLKLSVGGVAQFAIATSSWVVMMRLMARFGNEALAGYTFAIRIIIFTLLPAWGMGNAAATLVGQNLGAGQPERAEKSVYLTGCYNMAFLCVVSVVFIFFGEVLMRVFTRETEVIRVGTDCLRVLGFGYVLYGWGMVLVQSFNGAGDTMTPTWLNLFTFWAFQIPLAWFLTGKIGHAGVYWAVMCADVLLFFLVLPLFRRGKWKAKIV